MIREMKSLLFLTAVVCLPARPEVRKAHRGKGPAASFLAARINDSNQLAAIGPHAKGSAVVRAQILLDRAHYSCGEIDGNYGSNLEKTVTAFQRARNLTVDGVVGAGTWAVLNADQAPALFTYTIAQEDVAGPFSKVPANLEEQAKLPTLGYESPLEGLGEKF